MSEENQPDIKPDTAVTVPAEREPSSMLFLTIRKNQITGLFVVMLINGDGDEEILGKPYMAYPDAKRAYEKEKVKMTAETGWKTLESCLI